MEGLSHRTGHDHGLIHALIAYMLGLLVFQSWIGRCTGQCLVSGDFFCGGRLHPRPIKFGSRLHLRKKRRCSRRRYC